MAELHVHGKDGTPCGKHLYAVFHDEAAAIQAEHDLEAQGFLFRHLRGAEHAAELKDCHKHGLLWKIERLVKKIGGESHEAQRYAKHLDDGDVVVAMPIRDRQLAVGITQKLTQYGAYDVTYYTGWTIEHTSWESDSARGLPTYTTSNTETGPAPYLNRIGQRMREQ